jgi:hypothetical protein
LHQLADKLILPVAIIIIPFEASVIPQRIMKLDAMLIIAEVVRHLAHPIAEESKWVASRCPVKITFGAQVCA